MALTFAVMWNPFKRRKQLLGDDWLSNDYARRMAAEVVRDIAAMRSSRSNCGCKGGYLTPVGSAPRQQKTNNTNMVSQTKIDEAKARGIVPGAKISCARVESRYGTVMPTSQWEKQSCGGLIAGLDNGGTPLFAYSAEHHTWARVIDPSPGSLDCLCPGDAVRASGPMLAAIADRAAELGLLNRWYAGRGGSSYAGSGSIHWAPDQVCTLQIGYQHVKYDLLSPAEFLRRMENTRPPEEKIVIREGALATDTFSTARAEHVVKFNNGSITVGCTTITNDVVRKIASKLKD